MKMTIMELIQKMIREIKTSVLMITHDLGVMAQTCDHVAIMYAGDMVETGSVGSVLRNPQHPYTQGLLQTVPDKSNPDQPLFSIRGNVPSLLVPQTNCRFAPRCEYAMPRCRQAIPPLFIFGENHRVACFLHDNRPEAVAI